MPVDFQHSLYRPVNLTECSGTQGVSPFGLPLSLGRVPDQRALSRRNFPLL